MSQIDRHLSGVPAHHQPFPMIRPSQPGDHLAIAEIFSRAIHEIASEVYTAEQCEAWASRATGPEVWKVRCERKRPWVAVIDSKIAGFLELDPDGHIDCAYVNPDFRRRGVMTRLAAHAIDICLSKKLPRLWVDASICARPLFLGLGFEVRGENEVSIDGVSLVNYRMEWRHSGSESAAGRDEPVN